MTEIPISIAYKEKMTTVHAVIIVLCFLMNMCDGMSVMIISYVAPSILQEWTLDAGKFGIVFSAGLFGMALGAMVLASKADIIGRKNMIIICAFWMGISIFATAYTQTLGQLIFLRFFSGIGIGSMLAVTSTLAAEYAPSRSKNFWVSFVMAGYPVGAVISGLIAAEIIPAYGWRMMFTIAGLLIMTTLPILFFYLRESLEFLLEKRPQNALTKVNRTLHLMKLEAMPELPDLTKHKNKASLSALFGQGLKKSTFMLWISFFLSFTALYYLTSWIPKLATNAGLSIKLSIYAGLVFNAGAFLGIIIQGALSARWGLHKVIFFFLIGTGIVMTVFGLFAGSAWVLILFGVIGFGIQGGFIGLYAVAASIYPTEIRSTGIGWAIGFGRLGAIIGPLLGGLLMGAGLSMSSNFIIFAVPVFLSGILTLFISAHK